MGHELVQHVKLCQLVEDLDEASAKVALVAYEQQPGVVLKTLAPGRPALNGEISPIVVGVGTPQNLCALIARRGGETICALSGIRRSPSFPVAVRSAGSNSL